MKSKTVSVPLYYYAQARRYPRKLVGLLLSVPLTVLINNFLPPLIIAAAFKKLTEHSYSSQQLWPEFGGAIVAYFGLLLAGMFCWRLVDHFAWRLEAEVGRDMAEQVFKHLLRQTADFHANNFSGSLVSQTNKLLGGYIKTADTTTFQVYPLIIGLLFTNAVLIPKAPLFVLILDVFALLYILLALKISKSVQSASAKFAAAESQQTGYLADAVSNVMTIKSYARGDYEIARFKKATDKSYWRLFDFAAAHRRQMNTLGSMSRTLSGVSLAVAVVAVVIFKTNIGTMFLILSFTSRIVDQLFEFSNGALRNYARSWGDAADMVNILAKQPDILDPTNPSLEPIADGSINFNKVTFKHDGASGNLFDELSFSIKQGEKVGIVGHSGSGKSTLTRLLLRFSDIESGAIIVGGQNIARITQDALHASIAYVPQEPLLFHRTIGENIAYGKAKANKDDVVQAARNSHSSEFIDDLPKGYDTLVGERGVKLSGGQRQRIAIARAMLKDAPVLLLDEATSALDSESEVLIQDALWKLMEGRTAIVIAHRLSTIQKMDRIIVLDDGKIAEQGSHATLLKNKSTYAKLWAHQSGGFMDD